MQPTEPSTPPYPQSPVSYPQQPPPPPYQGTYWPRPPPPKPKSRIKWAAFIGGIVAFLGMTFQVLAVGIGLESIVSNNPFAALNAIYLFLTGMIVFGVGVMMGFAGLALPRSGEG